MISLSGWSPSCTLSALRRRVYRSHRRAKNNNDGRIPALHGSRAIRETGEWLSPLLLTRSHFSRSFCLVSAGFGFLIRHSTISGHIWKIKVCSGRVVLASVVMPLSIETPPYLSYSRRRLLQVVEDSRRATRAHIADKAVKLRNGVLGLAPVGGGAHPELMREVRQSRQRPNSSRSSTNKR